MNDEYMNNARWMAENVSAHFFFCVYQALSIITTLFHASPFIYLQLVLFLVLNKKY